MSSTVAEPLSLLPIEKKAAPGRDLPDGPGWFDSSWDLRRGLEVHEGWSGDERVAGWIEDFLRAQQALDRIAAPGECAIPA